MTHFITLSEKCIEMAAGMPVNSDAYTRWDLNLMRVKTMGAAYRRGWLHNVLGRITPLTAYSREDYLAMADLFVTTREQAEELLTKLNKDLTAFAAAAGYYASPTSEPAAMADHIGLYRGIASVLEQRFSFNAPAPFACGAVVDSTYLQNADYIRQFMSTNPNVTQHVRRYPSSTYID